LKLSPKLYIKGEGSVGYIHGRGYEPYSKLFNETFKKMIRERDEYICMSCDITKSEYKKTFDVHHIDYNKNNCTKKNCITLCRKCNIWANRNRPHWTKFFQSLLAEKYGYEYSETGEIILNMPQYQLN